MMSTPALTMSESSAIERVVMEDIKVRLYFYSTAGQEKVNRRAAIEPTFRIGPDNFMNI